MAFLTDCPPLTLWGIFFAIPAIFFVTFSLWLRITPITLHSEWKLRHKETFFINWACFLSLLYLGFWLNAAFFKIPWNIYFVFLVFSIIILMLILGQSPREWDERQERQRIPKGKLRW